MAAIILNHGAGRYSVQSEENPSDQIFLAGYESARKLSNYCNNTLGGVFPESTVAEAFERLRDGGYLDAGTT